MLDIESLFGSDRAKPACRQVYGISGTGKTVFLCESLRKAARSKSFSGKHRFIIFDVKGDGYQTLAPPTLDAETAISKMESDKLVVIHPDISTAPRELDEIINHLFRLADADKEFSGTLVLEECSTFIGSSTGGIPDSIKRLATQGRSKGLTLILVNQRALTNKWTDSQSQGITMFRLAKPDAKMLNDRWGLNADEIDKKLAENKFSFAHYDLEDLSVSYYDPIELPDFRVPIIMPKKSRFTKFFKFLN
tara:strand:- start:807 stop:1553 length:747 start_codon:yes stop_codon:yes gene_type:complete